MTFWDFAKDWRLRKRLLWAEMDRALVYREWLRTLPPLRMRRVVMTLREAAHERRGP